MSSTCRHREGSSAEYKHDRDGKNCGVPVAIDNADRVTSGVIKFEKTVLRKCHSGCAFSFSNAGSWEGHGDPHGKTSSQCVSVDRCWRHCASTRDAGFVSNNETQTFHSIASFLEDGTDVLGVMGDLRKGLAEVSQGVSAISDFLDQKACTKENCAVDADHVEIVLKTLMAYHNPKKLMSHGLIRQRWRQHVW